ncbi:MAG TPA: TPM domain-containing protein [Bacteroidales bacterium]|nr:TPM domain-containing protein [Bacteroidales bacterium]
MKKFFLAVIISVLTVVVHAIPSAPANATAVNDYAGFISPDFKAQLEQKLNNFADSTSTQIVVVIVNDLEGQDPNMYAYEIGQNWGVGQKGKNNGVVFLIKPKNENGKGRVAISVAYGLEQTLTDALSKRIIENDVIPFFKEGQYEQGIDAGVNAIMKACMGLYKAEPQKRNEKSAKETVIIFIIILIIFIVFAAKSKGRGSDGMTIGRGGSSTAGWFMMGSMMGSAGRSHNSGWGGFSSGSGGFGGFGGGSFGGGGASGSW